MGTLAITAPTPTHQLPAPSFTMNYKVLVMAAMMMVVLAAARPQLDDLYQPARYAFTWQVNDPGSGNSFGQTENRDDDLTEGRYEVLLPDNTKQIVTYYVDGDSGYVVDVQYEGEAVLSR